MAQSQEFKVGDVVQLKSGGPTMTIVDIGDGNRGRRILQCQWFKDDKPENDWFPPEALEPYDAGSMVV